jgi:hypothetical protein
VLVQIDIGIYMMLLERFSSFWFGDGSTLVDDA